MKRTKIQGEKWPTQMTNNRMQTYHTGNSGEREIISDSL
jgi:hypothetical protein